jgi:hypothetical protein
MTSAPTGYSAAENAADMSDLTAAHRGYEYQDLMEAGHVVDLLLDGIARAYVDEKLVTDDRFGDLTVINPDRCREHTQFKHSDEEDSLGYTTFTTDNRGLRLDRLVMAAIADRDDPGAGATAHRLRIVMRDAPPDDDALNAVMVPARPSDTPFLPGITPHVYVSTRKPSSEGSPCPRGADAGRVTVSVSWPAVTRPRPSRTWNGCATTWWWKSAHRP